MSPCYEVGGDYYNVFEVPGGTLIALIDVSGKGVGSAMVAFSIHTFLSLRVGGALGGLSELAASLNRFMLDTFDQRKYATGVLLLVHHDHRIEYLSAGHPAVLQIASGERHLLTSTSMPLGLLEQATYEQRTLTADAGDLFFMCSDGYDETANPDDEEFGCDRLHDAVAEVASSELESIGDHVHDRLGAFQLGAPTGDDRTMLLLRAV